MIRINIQITEEQHEQLRKLSFNTRLSIAEHVRQALDKYLTDKNLYTGTYKLKEDK